jgi:hypothetical protein
MPEPVPEATSESEPELELKPQQGPEVEPEPELIAEQESVAEPEPETKPEAETEPIPTAIELTVDEMFAAYRADEAAADARFGNNILRLTGLVNRIEVKDYLDFDHINLTNAENDLLEHVRCFFDKRHGPELDQLTIGQEVTVQGTYKGSMVCMQLRGCVLVS